MSVQLQNLSSESAANLEDIDITTYMGSCQFICKLMPCAISTILFKRYAINEKYVNMRYLAGVPYVGFRSTLPREHCAFKLHQVAQKMKECITKKYLKEIHITVFDKDTQKIIDQFRFKVTYLPGTDGSYKRDKTADIIIGKFFKKINEIPNKENITEEQLDIKFNWQFYNEIPNSELLYNFKPVPISKPAEYMSIASAQTPYHKLHALIALNNHQHSQEEAEDSENQPNPSGSTATEAGPSQTRKSQNTVERLQEIFDYSLPEVATPKKLTKKLSTKKL